MIQVRTVLCPTDFSDVAGRALEHAIALTRWYQAALTVLHVVPRLPSPSAAEDHLLLQRTRADGVALELERLLEPARLAGVAVKGTSREGSPAPEILAAAAEGPADLLVMGTHGRGGFERAVLGSVTEKVMRRITRPVLTVPPSAGPPAAGGAPPFARILCPVDFSESSLPALELALSLAQESDARLTLLHVMEGFAGGPASGVSSEPDRLQAEAQARLAELLPAGVRDWCHPRELVTRGRAWREILRLAREEPADVIVMGAYGAVLDSMLFGSTAQAVVRQATCPVLTARPR